MTDYLGDHASTMFVLSEADAVAPSPREWTVVVGASGEPISALPPGDPVAVAEIVVAEADTPVDLALEFPALKDLEPGCPVVCVRDGAVVGLWAGDDLIDALMRGTVRLSSDSQLPGRIRIPTVLRQCRFVEDAVPCGSTLSVVEKPETMPLCPNTSMLAAHTFVW
jgi:hypothetical protein